MQRSISNQVGHILSGAQKIVFLSAINKFNNVHKQLIFLNNFTIFLTNEKGQLDNVRKDGNEHKKNFQEQ